MGLRRVSAWAVPSLMLCAAAASGGLFGRDTVASRWTAAPLPVNGDDSDWDASSAFETDGLAVSARNDADALYLLVTAHTSDGRAQLTGEARENVALWFTGANGKTRDWGVRLPFSRRSPLTEELRDPAGVDPAPEYARVSGPVISTAAWPAELVNRMAISARRPVWELKIPRRLLTLRPDGTVAVDFAVTENGPVRRAPQTASLEQGRRGLHPPPAAGAPEGVALFLSVRLAKPPEAGR